MLSHTLHPELLDNSVTTNRNLNNINMHMYYNVLIVLDFLENNIIK